MNPSRARHLCLAVIAAVAAAAASGCGADSHPLKADTEGIYVSLGSLRYQVQLSRQLNPREAEDFSYLHGLSPADAHLKPGQAFFGIWMLVENKTGQDQTPALDFQITDTQDNVYRPVVPDRTNQFAYRPLAIPAHGQIPDPASLTYGGPIQGSLVLFKVAETSYDNRPLVLSITDPRVGKTAIVDLDV